LTKRRIFLVLFFRSARLWRKKERLEKNVSYRKNKRYYGVNVFFLLVYANQKNKELGEKRKL